MKKEIAKPPAEITRRDITAELKDSYLDYAMSVIVARALPDVRDGMKPVQRRILWNMWDGGLTHSAKFRKSANVVGEVLGRYHPHGDVPVYDAMVRMAQDFSLRYPLVEGQGNFGSVDGDAPAAYRYTEARLSKIAGELLTDIEKETVEWRDNYDATRKEPSVLPARLPGLLLNGAVGIAVGMATNIPPHNLSEVADALVFFLENPKATSDDALRFVKGPDFPTGGAIFDTKAIREAYLSGKGSFTTRGRVEIEEKKKGQFHIVITEIPYQVNKAELVKQIAELVHQKKVEGIRDLRDESDREGMRVVVELKTDVTPQKVLNTLYKHTNLQKDFHLNMIALSGGIEPELLSIGEVLREYLEYRIDVVRKRTEFDLTRAKERLHILEGLKKALGSIDRVIATIKKSKDREDAAKNLKKTFKFTDIQAGAILEMRLQALAALERKKIEDELKEKEKLVKELESILKSPVKLKNVVKGEIEELKKTYGDDRRTEVVTRPVGEFKEEDFVPEEEAMITLSASGYVKRISPDVFTRQKRGGRGLIGSDLGDDDILTHFVEAGTHDAILFFTDRGRVFRTQVYEIPAASRTAKGRAIHNFLELASDEHITAIVTCPKDTKKGGEGYLTMVTKNGVVKRTSLDEFSNIRRTGIIALNLKKGDELHWVRLSPGDGQIILTTEEGQSVRFEESKVRAMSRSAAGVRGMALAKGDAIAGCDVIPKGSRSGSLLVVMAKGYGKQTPLKEFKVQNRGGKGIIAAKVTERTGRVIAARVVTDEEEIFALSQKGQVIRSPLKDVRTSGRATQGVRVMNLKAGDGLAAVVAF